MERKKKKFLTISEQFLINKIHIQGMAVSLVHLK